MNPFSSSAESYLKYIQKVLPSVSTNTLHQFSLIIDKTSWDEPQSSADWNNIAVVAMSEAENSDDNLVMRSVYLEMAIEALNNGLEIDNNPICATHLALIYAMIGEVKAVSNIVGQTFIYTLQSAYTLLEEDNYNYLFFIFLQNKNNCTHDQKIIEHILTGYNFYKIAIFLLSQVLLQTQPFFFNSENIRFLYLAAQLQPNLVNLGLKLGISNLMIGHIHEGMLFLHQTRNLLPTSAPILQSLYLAYRDLNQIELANSWQETARKIAQFHPSSLEWQWTQVPDDSPFTYLPFTDDLIMAVEPSFHSIVTSALITEQDWFENEMEFWRSYLKLGMTVIDVGANAGVYTFSAAVKVGNTGRVFAVEPFSGCVRCLQETCRINQLSWVKVCRGAASDSNGTIKLVLNISNELNQVIKNDPVDISSDSFEEVPCFTLDSLIEKENIENLDFLKLDAEGHEMSVLAGSQQLINRFAPVILYENIVGSEGINVEVSEYLKNIGYRLFYYQPYTRKLIAADSDPRYQYQLNLIAVPPNKISIFNSIFNI
jgi:FkbM family methyltransferase